MVEHVEKTPEARWRLIRDGGNQKKIDLSSIEPSKPKWLDEEKFAAARAAVQKFYLGINMSSLTGLFLILQTPQGLEPLLSTGNSKDIPSLFNRYLNTILHVRSWYETDVFDPQSKGYKSIRQVRAMHKHLQGLMNDKFKVPDPSGKPHNWFNQFEVAGTQFSFIGLAMLYPEKCGLIAASKHDLELINYYWRVLGYLMGIEDDFNLCQFDTYAEIREFFSIGFSKLWFESVLKTQDCKKGLEMTQSICIALEYYLPLITFNGLAHWWKEEFSFAGYELQPMTFKEKLIYAWQKFAFYRLLKSERFLSFSTKIHKHRFEARVKNRDQVYEKLKTRYLNSTKHTFYSDRVNYFSSDRAEDIEKTAHQEVCEGRNINDDNNNQEDDKLVKTSPPETGGCPFGFGPRESAEVVQVSN